jgi:2-(1,2-epoxy-1,2-dihydrophenyl)acetyl-CoA isomerase
MLKLVIENQVATITLNRPEVYNAFNDELSYELQRALKQVSQDSSVRVVILTGAGKAFSSGQDLKATPQPAGKRNLGESLEKRYNPIIRQMRSMPKPIICKLNGVAAGAGCSIALACDLLIASSQSYLVEAFIGIGLVPDSGSSYFLPRTLGYYRSFELMTQGNKISAEQALQWGLVNAVVAPEDLDQVVMEKAQFYAQAPTKAIALIKKMLTKGTELSLEDTLQYEVYCQEIAGFTKDHAEGVQAFAEKRKPVFNGQ